MRILLSESELTEGVERLASEIDTYYGDRPLTVIAIMTGSLVLFADLIRRLSMPQRVGVIRASSYRGGTTSGELKVDADMMIDVADRDVLLVDDIFDTGKTLDRISGMMQEFGATSVRTAVLLHKRRDHDVKMRPTLWPLRSPTSSSLDTDSTIWICIATFLIWPFWNLPRSRQRRRKPNRESSFASPADWSSLLAARFDRLGRISCSDRLCVASPRCSRRSGDTPLRIVVARGIYVPRNHGPSPRRRAAQRLVDGSLRPALDDVVAATRADHLT